MLKEMKSQKHLKPGQNGTKHLVEQYVGKLGGKLAPFVIVPSFLHACW